MDIQIIHHVTLAVRDLESSRKFYREVLGLAEIARPPFPFAGAWFQAGAAQQLHLIVNPEGTFRAAHGIDTRDVHFAVRVLSYAAALASLRALGYRENTPAGDPRQLRINPRATAGFPQIYILDPDRHVIEVNAEVLDE